MTEVEMPASGRTGELCLPPALRKPRLRRWEASEYLRIVYGIEVATATLRRSGRGSAAVRTFTRVNRTPLYPSDRARRLGDRVVVEPRAPQYVRCGDAA